MAEDKSVFVPLEIWKPDGSDHGQELEVASNLLPAFGSWRAIRKPREVAALASSNFVTGAHMHAYQQAVAAQYLRPISVTSVTDEGWTDPTTGDDSTSGRLHKLIRDEGPNLRTVVRAQPSPAAVETRITEADGDTRVLENGSDIRVSQSGSITDGVLPEIRILFSAGVAPPAGSDGVLRYIYRARGWTGGSRTITARLVADRVATPEVEFFDTAESGSGDQGWKLVELAVAEVDMASVADHETYELHLEASGSGETVSWRQDPDATDSGSWTSDAGEVHEALDDEEASYVHSEVVGPNNTSEMVLSLNEETAPSAAVTRYYVRPLPGGGWVVRFSAKGDDGVRLLVELRSGTQKVATTTVQLTSADTAYSIKLSEAEFDSVDDWDNMNLRFVASYGEADVSESTYQVPVSDQTSSAGWGPSINRYAMVNGGAAPNDGTWVDLPTGTHSDKYIEFGLESAINPKDRRSHIVETRAEVSGTGTLLVELRSGSVVVASDTFTLTDTLTTHSFTLTDEEAKKIASYATLKIRCTFNGGASSAVSITNVHLRTPRTRKASVLFAYLDGPPTGFIDVAWVELEIPSANTDYIGDSEQLYAGDRTKLYTVSEDGISDVSISGGYVTGTDEPAAWHFCTFGDGKVIATNYADEVQVRSSNTGLFADLITSPSPAPKARFVAATRSHLFLGDINATGRFPDEIMWSELNNIVSFDTNDAGSQRINSQPGQIMGLVGGEFLKIFKRRSIHAAFYVGGAFVYRIEEVTNSCGTNCPGSIVEADNLIFFWDGGCFRMWNPSAPPSPDNPAKIGVDFVSRYLTDRSVADNPVFSGASGGMVAEDLRMSGCYDFQTGTIAWLYRRGSPTGDPATLGRHDKIILYNIFEQRWSILEDDDLDGSVMVTGFNPSLRQYEPMDGIHGLRWDGTNISWIRFDEDVAYGSTLTTKRRMVMEEGATRITGVQLVFTSEPGDNWPPIRIQVTASRDPRGSTNPTTEMQGEWSTSERRKLPFKIGGNWFVFEVTIPEHADEYVQAIEGLRVFYQDGGDR